MPELKACLFDLDGVIVDTARFHYIAWRQLANDLGFDLSVHDNEQLKGVSRMESLEIILKLGGVQISEEEKLQRAAVKNARYLELCKQMTPADTLPGVRAFLDELKRASILIGLGSASKNARIILERIDILSYFDTQVDGNRITKGKPDPQVFEMGAADLGVSASQCVVFEDAVAGIQSAKAAKMFAVGIGDPQILVEADLVVPGFSDFSLTRLKETFENRNIE